MNRSYLLSVSRLINTRNKFLIHRSLKSLLQCLYTYYIRFLGEPMSRHSAAAIPFVPKPPETHKARGRQSKSNRNHRGGNGARFTGKTDSVRGQKRWMTVISVAVGGGHSCWFIRFSRRRRKDKVGQRVV